MKTETNEILEEVYRARQEILEECGGTLHGLFLRFSKREPGLKYCEVPPTREREETARRTPKPARARRNPAKRRTTAKHARQEVKP